MRHVIHTYKINNSQNWFVQCLVLIYAVPELHTLKKLFC